MMSRPLAGLVLVLAVAARAGAETKLKLAKVESQGEGKPCAVPIALDDTGVADWSFMNPRNPPYVFGLFQLDMDDPRIQDDLAKVAAKPGLTDAQRTAEREAARLNAELEQVRLFALGRPPARNGTRATVPNCDGHVELVLTNRSSSQELLVKLQVPKPPGDCAPGWEAAGPLCKHSERVPAAGAANVHLDLTFLTRALLLVPPEFDETWWREVLNEIADRDLPEAAVRQLELELGIDTSDQKATYSEFRDESKDLPPKETLHVPQLQAMTVDTVTEETYGQASPTRFMIAARISALSPARAARAASNALPLLAAEDPATALEVMRRADAAVRVKLAEVKRPAATFTVEFYASADPPANPKGYFLVWEFMEEPASTSALKSKVEASLIREPELPTGDVFLNAASPYGGQSLRHWSGAGTLTAAQTLGNRATASVSLKFRGNDFGTKDDLNVATSQYQLDVYNSAFLTASIGRFQFLSPSDGIAISEFGDGARLRYHMLSLSRRAKRESKDGKANDANQDSTAWILTADNLATPALSAVRSVSLVGLLGRESSPLVDADQDGRCDAKAVCPHSYATLGGSLNFAVPEHQVGGSLGLYHSRRFDTEGLPKGQGTVGLLTLSRTIGQRPTPTAPFKTDAVFGLAFGYGTGDKPGTAVDESYIGETASYVSDSTFLGSLAARTRVVDGQLMSPGLSNKTYVRASLESRLFSPLVPLAQLLGAGPKDIDSQSIKIVWNYYRFNELVGGSHGLGHEIVLSTDVASPPGVTVSITYARFFPSGALSPVFSEHEPWRVAAKLSASLP